MTAGGENVVGVLGLFLIQFAKSFSCKTSEAMMAFNGSSHGTCWQETPTWRLAASI
jgi:hypothetical protein